MKLYAFCMIFQMLIGSKVKFMSGEKIQLAGKIIQKCIFWPTVYLAFSGMSIMLNNVHQF